MDVKLNVVTGTSYSAMIEAQEAGKAQIVSYGPFSYYIATNHGLKIQNVGILTDAPNTDGAYYSEAVVDPQRTPDITLDSRTSRARRPASPTPRRPRATFTPPTPC